MYAKYIAKPMYKFFYLSRYLQNPSDCSKARKLVCSLNKGCGFGCQVNAYNIKQKVDRKI